VGHSMGGYVTLQAMVVSDAIDAGVIWAGVVGGYPDLFARGAATATAVAAASPTATPAPGTPTALPPAGAPFPWPRLAAIYGSPEENPAFWRSISATSYLADLSARCNSTTLWTTRRFPPPRPSCSTPNWRPPDSRPSYTCTKTTPTASAATSIWRWSGRWRFSIET
jgi:hypothetical protein